MPGTGPSSWSWPTKAGWSPRANCGPDRTQAGTCHRAQKGYRAHVGITAEAAIAATPGDHHVAPTASRTVPVTWSPSRARPGHLHQVRTVAVWAVEHAPGKVSVSPV